MIGSVLNERYEILDRIGDGGMSIVYRARDLIEKRTVAVKVLRPEHVSDEDSIRRFRREAEATQRLQHPNLVELFDISVDTAPYFLVMEYVDGVTLHSIIKQGKMPYDRIIEITWQIAEALQYAHQNRVIHRDIKPQNVLIGENDKVKVSDFGIAILASQTTIVHTRSIIGTAHYFSPEQAKGDTVTEQSDLYSLGVVLYEMISGQLPFDGETPVAIALKHIQDEPHPLSELRPDTPRALEDIVMRLMEKDTDMRYVNIEEVLADLELIADQISGASGDFVQRFKNKVSPHNRNLHRQRLQKRILRWLTAIIFFGCLGIGVIFGAWQFLFPISEVFEVPEVVGMTLEQATVLLRAYNLDIRISDEVHDASQLEGIVLHQVQQPGLTVKNPIIDLVISRGPESFALPKVTDQAEREAVLFLEGKGLVVHTRNQNSPTVAKGTVLDQIPRADTVVYAGIEITLIISSGPEQVKVPNVVRMSYDEAVLSIAEHGLSIGTVITAFWNNDQFPANAVIEQLPAAEAAVAKGEKVNLTLNTSESVVHIPTIYFDNGAENYRIKIVIQDSSKTAPPNRIYLEKDYPKGSKPLELQSFVIQSPGVVLVYVNNELLYELVY